MDNKFSDKSVIKRLRAICLGVIVWVSFQSYCFSATIDHPLGDNPIADCCTQTRECLKFCFPSCFPPEDEQDNPIPMQPNPQSLTRPIEDKDTNTLTSSSPSTSVSIPSPMSPVFNMSGGSISGSTILLGGGHVDNSQTTVINNNYHPAIVPPGSQSAERPILAYGDVTPSAKEAKRRIAVY